MARDIALEKDLKGAEKTRPPKKGSLAEFALGITVPKETWNFDLEESEWDKHEAAMRDNESDSDGEGANKGLY